MDPLIWAGILLAFGLSATALELFIPSGGVLGLLSLVCLLSAVGLAFHQNTWAGMGFLAAVVVGVPCVLGLAVRWWPSTRMGRRLLLEVPTEDEVLPDSELRRGLKSLLGKVGEARTLMTPSGAVLIEGRTINALSEGLTIEPGQRVRVVEVRGNRVVVQPTSQAPTVVDPGDPLSQPIESLGLDPFEDPLG
jgi:membrane-bound ClpP family serine protease